MKEKLKNKFKKNKKPLIVKDNITTDSFMISRDSFGPFIFKIENNCTWRLMNVAKYHENLMIFRDYY